MTRPNERITVPSVLAFTLTIQQGGFYGDAWTQVECDDRDFEDPAITQRLVELAASFDAAIDREVGHLSPLRQWSVKEQFDVPD